MHRREDSKNRRERAGTQALRDAAFVLVLLVLFGSVRFGGPSIPADADRATAAGLVPAAHASGPETVTEPMPAPSPVVEVLDSCELRRATASERPADGEPTIHEELILPAGAGRVEASIDRAARTMSLVLVRDVEQTRVFEVDLGQAAAAAERIGRRMLRDGVRQQFRLVSLDRRTERPARS